jgi:hypothetical protein
MTGKSQYEIRAQRERDRTPGIKVSGTAKPSEPAQPAEDGPNWKIIVTVAWFVITFVLWLANGSPNGGGGEHAHSHGHDETGADVHPDFHPPPANHGR